MVVQECIVEDRQGSLPKFFVLIAADGKEPAVNASNVPRSQRANSSGEGKAHVGIENNFHNDQVLKINAHKQNPKN